MKKIAFVLSILTGVSVGATTGALASSQAANGDYLLRSAVNPSALKACTPVKNDPSCCIDDNGNMMCS